MTGDWAGQMGKEGTQPERKVEPKEGFFDSVEGCERLI